MVRCVIAGLAEEKFIVQIIIAIKLIAMRSSYCVCVHLREKVDGTSKSVLCHTVIVSLQLGEPGTKGLNLDPATQQVREKHSLQA